MSLRKPLLLGLIGLTALGSGAIAIAIIRTMHAPSASAAAHHLASALPPLSLPAATTPALVEDYAVILENPVFSPLRHFKKPEPVVTVEPEPVPEPAPAPVPPQKQIEPLRLTLVGIAVINGIPQALLKSATEADLVRLRAGETYREWRLDDIQADLVRFSAGDQVAELLMLPGKPAN